MLSKFLKRHPVLKTMAAYMAINTLADINEQLLIKGRTRENYIKAKTVRIGVVGGFAIGPMIYIWIKTLERLIPGKTAVSVAKKVVVDAFCFAPVLFSTFYIATNILEGRKDLTAEWKEKIFITWTTGLMFWPLVQTVNFAFIPLRYKTSIFMPTASFIWMNYLCFMKEKVTQKEEVPVKEIQEPIVASTELRSSHLHPKQQSELHSFPKHDKSTSQPHKSHPHITQSSVHKVEDGLIVSNICIPVINDSKVD